LVLSWPRSGCPPRGPVTGWTCCCTRPVDLLRRLDHQTGLPADRLDQAVYLYRGAGAGRCTLLAYCSCSFRCPYRVIRRGLYTASTVAEQQQQAAPEWTM
jgi:hypothetical protein